MLRKDMIVIVPVWLLYPEMDSSSLPSQEAPVVIAEKRIFCFPKVNKAAYSKAELP